MAPFRIFRRREKGKGKEAEKEAEVKTILDELCGDDAELKNVLSSTLLLNPNVTAQMGGIDSHIERAQRFEENKENVRARVEYHVAGELALYEGKLAHVQKLFKKAAEVDPNYPNKSVYEFFTKKENAEKALDVAKEYYTRTSKAGEK